MAWMVAGWPIGYSKGREGLRGSCGRLRRAGKIAAARCGHASTTVSIKHKINGGEAASQI
jgi:hypothetical protein